MTAGQLLVVGLACLAAGFLGFLGALLLWLDGRLEEQDEEDREAFHLFTNGRRP